MLRLIFNYVKRSVTRHFYCSYRLLNVA